jgi:hypothetical protein
VARKNPEKLEIASIQHMMHSEFETQLFTSRRFIADHVPSYTIP